MSTYCSIQEAWNEPSFSKPRKATPNKMQCGNANNGIPSPNNLYTNQNGNEQAAYMQYLQQQNQKQNTSQNTPQKTARTPSQRPLSTPKMVETFMCGGPAAAIPTGSTGMMSQQYDPATGNIPYAVQANDYKYYCDNMGVCPMPDISIEGFATQQQPPQQPQQQQQMEQECQTQQQRGCQMSEQSTTYTYPISDLTKQQFDTAMNVYLNNGKNSQNCQNGQKNTPKKLNSEITGLYDDEISQYMRVQDMSLPYENASTNIYTNSGFPSQQFPKPKQVNTPLPFDNNITVSNGPNFQPANNTALVQAHAQSASTAAPSQAQAQAPYVPMTGPNTIISNNTQQQTQQDQQKPQTSKWQYIMDTVLYIAAGILIIILCDLLFKIAYSVGMRDTFKMMQPYITEIEELKSKIAEFIPEDE